ncbi:GTPase involved in cell partioning and DNA repair [[Clostridium] ultunense Esp]|uniref:GTPase Obg n=1 Tax=[Clostridium] ultunense Esp TaxID=1288971 RepID=M1YPZ6_9FIRM|nr:GTPase ObgE [Schnuerera ultunensis]CCQ92620.1 GTPase involved in cell partioning and DNA repair [[Clostridium] ultunense Esp]SHD77932.1 ppGpp-binding GTPase involved in cell portioning, DNA repair and ribosome assembly [[Clostridium] ultunense Esp]
MFIDIAKINLKAGKGGDGAVAFRREKYEPAGGPYGGDGGNGGNIIIQGDEGIRTLMDFRYKRSYKAENGENGKTKKQFGKKGQDLILRVPVGTLVKDGDSGKVIVDIKEHNQSFIIAKGGKGGRGNAKFATPTRQAPRFAEPGTKGEERTVILELKLLADVGLIGFPNVGKSTILSILSEAKPKIANYHFTTLKPNLGVVRVDEEQSFVIADIPGLIEGAHQGVGLGHDFLRHVERTKILVHVLDASGIEGRNPIEDFYKINEELIQYNPKLKEKHQIIVANKMDLFQSKEWIDKVKEEFEPLGYEVFPLSAATMEGINRLKYGIWEVLKDIEIEYETFDEKADITFEESEKDAIIVRKENGIYIVEGSFIERLIYSTNFDNHDSLRYFQNTIRQRGVVDQLKELGIEENDTVLICGYEFEFFD